MAGWSKAVLGVLMAAGVLLPDLAAAMPLGASVETDGSSLVVRTGGVVCDAYGCRSYGHHHRRFYRDPPLYDDPGFYDAPPVYVQPRVRRRVYVEPAPIYREPPVILSPEHVQWCLDRYRSYNPRTNLFMVRRNVFRQCVSPWS